MIEQTDRSTDDLEFTSFDANNFVKELCESVNNKNGLNTEHGLNFKRLVRYLRSRQSSEAVALYESSKAVCGLAG